MRHEFKDGDAVNTGSPAETRRLLHLAKEKGYPVFFASLDTTHSIAFNWYKREFVGESILIRGAMSPEYFEELINPKPENMRHEFNEGDGVFTSCKEETRKLLQLAKSKGYQVFEQSMTETNHNALCFLRGRFVGANEATVVKRMAKTIFIKIMNETIVETPKPQIPMINKNDIIIIPAELQREMFAAATQSQMPFLDKHINLKTGAITKGGMMEIYNVACHSWQERLAKEWNWLKIKPLTIVFGEKTDDRELFGNGHRDTLIQTYIMDDEFKDKTFFLNDRYRWKIVLNKYEQQVLVPERK